MKSDTELSVDPRPEAEATQGQHCSPGGCPLQAVIGLEPASAHESIWARAWGLQPRHARVAALMIQGLPDRKIAEQLGLTLSTARTYSHEVLQAADEDNRTSLVLAAIRVTASGHGQHFP